MQLRQRQKRINGDGRGHRLVLRAEVFSMVGKPLPTSLADGAGLQVVRQRFGHSSL
jgi:hypothetical protein